MSSVRAPRTLTPRSRPLNLTHCQPNPKPHRQGRFRIFIPLLLQQHRLGLLIDRVVEVPLEDGGYLCRHLVLAARLVGLSGDDEGRPGLVDEDGIDLVDDAEVEVAL
jgi:hypothetical protein